MGYVRDGVLPYAVAAFSVFIGSAIVGYMFPSDSVSDVASYFSFYTSLPAFHRAVAIFVNNMFVAAILLVASLLIVPGLYVLAANGYVIGSLLAVASRSIPLSTLLLAILPHGVFEVIVYSYVSGVSLQVLRGLASRRLNLHTATTRLLKAFAASVYILLVAAFIESFLVIG
jgi:stage II sporulation protein M